jgi:two-component system, cell cycle sensor histidine kinase and response regulator CckA
VATVLIVDDEAASRQVLRLLLTDRGHEVVEAVEGRQALDLVRDSPPDLVVTDALMPDMDGYELARAIRDHEATAAVPVLLFSGNYNEEEMGSVADACGASRVIAKTSDAALFLHAVEEMLTEAGPDVPAAPDARDAPSSPDEFASRHLQTVKAKLVTTSRDLHRTAARLTELAEAAPVGIFLTDATGEATYTNPALTGILGAPAEELLGPGWQHCLGTGQLDGIQALARGKASPGGQQHRQSRISHPDGSRRWLDTTIQPLPSPDHQLGGAVGIVSDITLAMEAAERGQAEQRRLAMEAAQRAGDRMEALRRMAGGIAHDYNNMLAVVLNYAEFLADAIDQGSAGQDLPADLAAGLQSDLAELMKAGRRAADTTAVLHQFAARMAVIPAPQDINEVTGRECDLLARQLEKTIKLDVQLGEGLPLARAGIEHVEEILRNLTSNAIDAMPDGGILRIGTVAVDIAPAAEESPLGKPPRPHSLTPGSYVELTVADTGTGMTADVLDHAIEPFFTTRLPPHNGLGLTAAYGALYQVGGDLIIDTEPGEGTIAHAYVPAVPAPAAAAPTPAGQPGRAESPTVLVVDDEPGLRKIAERILRRAGYTVLVAEDGRGALRLASEHPGPIQYLLTDVVMPHMLGSELARQMTAGQPGIRVLYMSGFAEPMLGSDNPADADAPLITKPFSAKDLLAALTGLDRAGSP